MKITLLFVMGLCAAVSGLSGCSHKVDCGFPGISQQQCQQRGCCWDSSAAEIWCSAPACANDSACSGHGQCIGGACQCEAGFEGWNCAQTTITTVHVVQSCHLDVGFADSSVGIINLYFDHHFPMAIQVGQQMRANTSYDFRLRFMAQSYVVSLYLDCPLGMGLHCPNATARQAFIEAVQVGDITWHAFPFNAEPELYDPVLVAAGVELSHMLDRQFGLPLKATMSQRDVPGMTSGIVPWLVDSGVSAISVGVNSASTPPDVPTAFVWRDQSSGAEVLAMWHPYGYGGYEISDAVIVPGLSHALVFDWNGDNAGPYTADEYFQHFEQIQKEFPNAQVVSSTFDNFTQYLAQAKSNLPVISNEIGDTWIYGVPSDAHKLAQLRAMNRAWAAFTSESTAKTRQLMNNDPVFWNATRLMLKNGEHTWGRDVKSNLQDNTNWANPDFEFARTQGPNRAQYGILEQSWWEQRQWGIDIPVGALQAAGHPLYSLVESEFGQLVPQLPNPSAAGYTLVTNVSGSVFTCGAVQLSFDATTGAVNGLHVGTQQWASATRTLGSLDYRTYSQQDIVNFLDSYLDIQPPPSWAFHDFGKPNCTVSQHTSTIAQLSSLWVQKSSEGACSFYVAQQFDASVVLNYGAPAVSWTQWSISSGSGSVEISLSLQLFNKTSTRLPEALFFVFNPALAANQQAGWTLSKLGQTIDVDSVVNGGGKHLHSADKVTFAGALEIDFVDASVACVGAPMGYPTPTNITADWQDYGVSSNLFNNLWGTNYIMWQPFNYNYTKVEGEENYLFRYAISLPGTLR
eukprot:TRINITY_DN499_c0_g1_i1.p1 TRINITY_DN499_c0_g1~~TRINITY_DN499_c0_g1_i1.p1  ORF type:complete len:799 (-),score=301.91 TRINITY_DN499_c0_g1_i1:735-3131(-)